MIPVPGLPTQIQTPPEYDQQITTGEIYSRDRETDNSYKTLMVTGTLIHEVEDCEKEKDAVYLTFCGVGEGWIYPEDMQWLYDTYYILNMNSTEERPRNVIYLGTSLPDDPKLSSLVNDGKEHTFWITSQYLLPEIDLDITNVLYRGLLSE